MANLQTAVRHLRHLDEVSQMDSPIHRLHPSAICLTTLFFIIVVVSYGPFSITPLIVLFFYPFLVAIFSDIPIRLFLLRLLATEPFVLGVAMFQPFFRQQPVLWNGIQTTAGWLVFISIILKSTLTISAAILLVAVTGIQKISAFLRAFHVPAILVTQFQLTYRYIAVLLEETHQIQTAYLLRAPNSKGIAVRAWGSLAGQLLIRSHRRADRVYSAMLLRGFHGEFPTSDKRRWRWTDWCWLLGWGSFFLFARWIDITAWLGAVLTGV